MAAVAAPLGDDRQNKCEAAARSQLRHLGWQRDRHATFVARYNETLKRCFVVLEISLIDGKRGRIVRSLGDAEGREYATYLSFDDGGAGSPDSARPVCEIVLASGEQMECQSLRDFDEIVKQYMH